MTSNTNGHTTSVDGAVIAVTGASAGIGLATARLLAARGARVVVHARRKDRLVALVDELGAERASYVCGDIGLPESSAELVAHARSVYGGLDGIVVNAGIGKYGGILDYSDAEIEEMMRTNIGGTVWPVRAAVAEFRSAGRGGDIVIVSSVAGLRAGGNEAVYGATKFAQVGLGGAVDREVREEGIRVSLVCPASTETEFALGAGREAGDPRMTSFLRAEDVATTIHSILCQPRRLRSPLTTMYSMTESS